MFLTPSRGGSKPRRGPIFRCWALQAPTGPHFDRRGKGTKLAAPPWKAHQTQGCNCWPTNGRSAAPRIPLAAIGVRIRIRASRNPSSAPRPLQRRVRARCHQPRRVTDRKDRLRMLADFCFDHKPTSPVTIAGGDVIHVAQPSSDPCADTLDACAPWMCWARATRLDELLPPPKCGIFAPASLHGWRSAEPQEVSSAAWDPTNRIKHLFDMYLSRTEPQARCSVIERHSNAMRGPLPPASGRNE